MAPKIPITIITGFLGSGKTTLLKRIIEYNTKQKTLYLINDFSPNDVDSVIISSPGLNVKSIAGGSIFCNCKITDFIEALKLTTDEHFDEIIIEASGIANPMAAGVMLMESKLDKTYYIKKVICLIDSTNFLQLSKSLMNLQNQVKSADLIIINKIDLASKTQLGSITVKIKTMNQTAKILNSQQCDVDLKNLEINRLDKFDSPTTNSGGYQSFSIKSKKNLNLNELEKYITVNNHIYRIKGFANINGDMHYLSYSGSGWNIQQISVKVNPHLEFIFYDPDNSNRVNKTHLIKIFFTNS